MSEPEIIVKQLRNGLMTLCYEHGLFHSPVTVFKPQAYCGNSFCNTQDFINAQIDVARFENTFKFLVHLISYKANTNMRLDTFCSKMKHRTYPNRSLRDSKSPLYLP